MVAFDAGRMASSYKGAVVGTIGSHSALEICSGARAEGLRNIVLCQRGREKTYAQHYKAAGGLGCVDETMVLSKFSQMANPFIVKILQSLNVVFVPNRSFSVYVGYDNIERKFKVPIFGNRYLLRAEERNGKKNQLWLLKKAGIRVPRNFKSPSEIDALSIVKVSEARRKYERAFFLAASRREYDLESRKLLKMGIIDRKGLNGATIEEFALGAQFNFNFFLSPLSGRLELLGTDMRRQTNLDGILRMPAREQIEALSRVRVNNIEVGHVACTIRESLLEKVFEIGERFVSVCRQEYPPGIIGPFALQGAVVPERESEEIVIFDVSFRVPGSPGIAATPYSEYLHGRGIGMGRRIAIEIRQARDEGKLGKVVT